MIKSTDTFVEVNVGGTITRINHSDLGAGGQKNLNDSMRDFIQAAIDVRIPLADLPDGSDPSIGDEPTRTVNPNKPNFFWGDDNGIVQNNADKNDHLIARDTVVTEVVFDGTRYVVTQVRVP